MILLGGFGRSARTRGWAVLDGLRSKELKKESMFHMKKHNVSLESNRHNYVYGQHKLC